MELAALKSVKYRSLHLFLVAIDPALFKLENSWMSLNFRKIGPLTKELATLECLKISNILIMGR